MTTTSSTRILSGELLERYVTIRLFGKNIKPKDAKEIHLYNGFLPSKVEQCFKHQYVATLVSVIQDNPREPIYFHGGTLIIPQYSSLGRQRRYRELCEAYARIDSGIVVREFYLDNGNPASIRKTYDSLAHDLVRRVFSNEPENAACTEEAEETKNISTFIFGPLNAVAKQSTVDRRENDEYLPYQIISINDNKAINFCYVYADQAAYIIKNITDWLFKRHKERKELQRADFFMYGRAGALADGVSIDDVVTPNLSIGEYDIEKYKNPHPDYLSNILAPEESRIIQMNAATVINQTRETLEKAKAFGCKITEMEAAEAAEAIKQTNRRYDGEVYARMGFAFHVSDRPLSGETLAEERDLSKGEQKAVSMILEYIIKH